MPGATGDEHSRTGPTHEPPHRTDEDPGARRNRRHEHTRIRRHFARGESSVWQHPSGCRRTSNERQNRREHQQQWLCKRRLGTQRPPRQRLRRCKRHLVPGTCMAAVGHRRYNHHRRRDVAHSRTRPGAAVVRPNAVKDKWARGEIAYGAWLTIPGAYSAEIVAHAGFDWVCIDMQHGNIDYQVATTMLLALSTTDTMPFVRVPWNEPGIIGKVLDAGAMGVIIPM